MSTASTLKMHHTHFNEVEELPPAASSKFFYGAEIPLQHLVSLRAHAKSIAHQTRMLTRSVLSGGQNSVKRGRGIDLAEVRAYQPGDDIRNLHWRVTARMDRPHTKLFQEEQERPLLILVDMSATMFFGSQVTFKSGVAAQAAALLAWAGAFRKDRVGGIIWDGQQAQAFMPGPGNRSLLPFLKYLAASSVPPSPNKKFIAPAERPLFSKSFETLNQLAPHGSLILFLSDFFGFNALEFEKFRSLSSHHELMTFFIYDPLEKEPPPPDFYRISDGKHLAGFHSGDKNFCLHYRKVFQEHHDTMTSSMKKLGIPFLEISTAQSIVDRLIYGMR